MAMLFLSTVVHAFESEPQPILLEDTATLFTNAEFSTGWVPSGSPIAVQFAIESVGGATAVMEGTAGLSWPDAFRLDFTPTAGGGLLLLDASLDAVTSIQIDLSDWGYKGTWEIDRRSFPMEAEATFDPFLLAGSENPRIEATDLGDKNELIYYSYEIVAGLSLDFAAYIRSETTVGFEGVDWVANGVTLTQEGQAAGLPLELAADYVVESIYRGQWDAALSLIFIPRAEACTAFGCVTLLEFELPLDLLTDTFEQDFPPDQQIFPIPLLQLDTSDRDLGDVPMGTLTNLEVPLSNDGSLTLTGTARIEGSADFSVYPTDFTAVSGGADGLVVSFAPTAEGPQEAFLLLDSNDPNQPQVAIVLRANGAEADVGEDVDEDPEQKPLSSCGCGTQASLGPLALLLAALLVRRR